MHRIQKYILSQLIFHPERRFSQLKPTEIESNHFMYHLNKLIAQKIVVKKGDRYQLTASGKRYVDRLNLDKLRPRIQPKIVTLIATKNNRGEYLLYERSRQPFFDMVGFPYGKIHLGETIGQAAKREFKEKTGLTARLDHRGDVYLTIYDGDELIAQMLCHIFSGTEPQGDLLTESQIGKCFWAKLKNRQDHNFMPGFWEVYKLLDSKQHFFAEYQFK